MPSNYFFRFKILNNKAKNFRKENQTMVMAVSNLNSEEIDDMLKQEMNVLVDRFKAGEINSYIAKVSFFDKLNESVSPDEQDRYRETMMTNIMDVILQGIKNPTNTDIESAMTFICQKVVNGSTHRFNAEDTFSVVLKELSDDDKQKWLKIFNEALAEVLTEAQNVDDLRKERNAKRYRQIFIFLEVSWIVVLLPLIIGIFVYRIEISSWALKSLLEIALGITYVFLIVKYNDYWVWRREKESE